MTNDDEVLELAAAEGFDLHERTAECTGHGAWGWHRGDADRWTPLAGLSAEITVGGRQHQQPSVVGSAIDDDAVLAGIKVGREVAVRPEDLKLVELRLERGATSERS